MKDFGIARRCGAAGAGAYALAGLHLAGGGLHYLFASANCRLFGFYILLKYSTDRRRAGVR